MLGLRFFLLVLTCFSFQKVCYSKSKTTDVCSVWSNDWRRSSELKSRIFTSVKPTGGTSAGKYARIKVNSWEECVSECCQFNRCNVAYWISSTCLHIECISDELCEPILGDNSDINDGTLYLSVRSVQVTAAALDFDDLGHDLCNETTPCPVNEQCEQASINAQLKRRVCTCDGNYGFRRINGVCRQYLPHTQPCALYENDYEVNDYESNLSEDNAGRGKCERNEECVPPNDRAKHGYCQCKLGFNRKNNKEKCVADNRQTSEETSTRSTFIPSTASSFDIEVRAGDDQTITLPSNQIDLYGHLLYRSNHSELDLSALNNRNLHLLWSLKSSTNGAKVDLSNPDESASHALVEQLREGTYEFELKLIDKYGKTAASDSVKVEVLSARTTTALPLVIVVSSPVTVYLPRQVVKLEGRVEPVNRRVTYQWTYAKDGPVTPTLENANTSVLSVSDLRPGKYSFRLHVVDSLNNEQTKTVQLIASGEPIEARVVNTREIVFWPSNDVILDGTPSILEQQTLIIWTLLSNDNKQKADEIDIVSVHSLKTRVSNLRIGQYRFQLTLTTNDNSYTSKKEVLVIVYTQNGQPPKVHIQLETSHVNTLNNLIVLNASKTTADYGIAKWQWTKSSFSPAMSHFINDSDSSPIAYITNLIEGQYIFHLRVIDDRQQTSERNITVHVDHVPDAEDLIEVTFVAKPYLQQKTLENLLAHIQVFLIDLLPNIQIVSVGMVEENVLLIKGKDSKSDLIIAPKLITEHLQKKIKSLRSASNVNILSINTYLCLSNCSNHGKCDQKTKRCVCHKYYMENWFKSIASKEPNCDFLIHYFVLITIVGAVLSVSFCWLCLCCCLRWRRRRILLDRRKRIRYQLLNETGDDDDDNSLKNKTKSKLRLLKKNKNKTSNLIVSESDYDMSDDNGEQTLYDKPLLTAKLQMQSPSNKSRELKVPVQDSNGSPMLCINGQSPTTTDNSVA